MVTEPEEIIFVLDRSGSMDGAPTEQLKYAMLAALKNFPRNAKFNMVEFGTNFVELFPSAQFPTFQNLYFARQRIFEAEEVTAKNPRN